MFYNESFANDEQNISGAYVTKLTSIFWGFFSGGARNVHTDIIQVLQKHDINHHVIAFYDTLDRGSEGIQSKTEDRNYLTLTAHGATVDSLGLTHHDTVDLYHWIDTFSGDELPEDPMERVVQKLAQKMAFDGGQAILCLKEQPANLLVLASRYMSEIMGVTPKPLFITLHRTDPSIQDPKAMQVLRSLEESRIAKQYITGYIGCSESSVIAYQEALGLKDEGHRFQFIANGIDLRMFRLKSEDEIAPDLEAIANQSGWYPQPDDEIITIGARNSWEKNVDLFIQAAYLMLQSNPKAHAVLCGSGMDAEGLKDNFHRAAQTVCIAEKDVFDMQQRIHPLGRLNATQMAAVLNKSQVVTLTSPTLGEADPLVLKEGMACGAIPVTTCCGDAPRVVGLENPRETMLCEVMSGMIVGSRGILTSQNPADIAQAWQYAINNKHNFFEPIGAYLPMLDRNLMGASYLSSIGHLMAKRSLDPLNTVHQQHAIFTKIPAEVTIPISPIFSGYDSTTAAPAF